MSREFARRLISPTKVFVNIVTHASCEDADLDVPKDEDSDDGISGELPPYPEELECSAADYARYILKLADRDALAHVLRCGPLKVGSFCTGMHTEKVVLEVGGTEITKHS